MDKNTIKKSQKIPTIFCCKPCDYNTCNKKDFNKHNQTQKHKILSLYEDKNPLTEKIFGCECGKTYKHASSLWNHRKKCDSSICFSQSKHKNDNELDKNEIKIENNENNKHDINDLIKYLMKENNELKNIMVEQQNKIMEQNNLVLEIYKNSTNHNLNMLSNNFSNNRTFNLHFFLNETCKNAMNITDFANSIKIQLGDLEKIGEVGYVEGISKIIIDNLKMLDITERPVHCSDLKREILYIKDEDKWEKENNEKSKIKKVINYVADQNICLIPEWKQKNPDCTKSESNQSNKINKMIMEVMETGKEVKIIKNIAKEVLIEKP